MEEEATGKRPLYREAHDGERDRYYGRISASANWFKRKGTNTDMEDYHNKGPMRRHPWRKQEPPGGGGGDNRPVEGVVFVPHTADSDLQRKLQKVDNDVTKAQQMPRTRYVERAGVTLRDLLVLKNPWYRLRGGCGRPSCHLCLSQKGKGTS